MIAEIELGKLMPNPYNPRKRMNEKYLDSLKKSLKEDGQLQTLLVRPQNDAGTIPKGHHEVVAGMRRYYSLKKIQKDTFKVECSVKEMTDEEAMILSFKENVERESVTPIDEAGWLFKMLSLHEEQLFQVGDKSNLVAKLSEHIGLPSNLHPDIKKLSEKLGLTPSVIADFRLPLLALPDELQDLLTRTSLYELSEKENPLSVQKAVYIARLRLIEDKTEAHKQMKIVWKNWGHLDRDEINKHVTEILEAYKENAEQTLKELGTLETTLEKRIKELDEAVKKCEDWLDSKNKKSIINQLPDAIKDKISVEFIDDPEKLFDVLDDLVTDITKDDTLSDMEDDLKTKQNNLIDGKDSIEDHKCIYCDSEIDLKKLEKKIDELTDNIDTVHSDIEKKDSLRGTTETLKRSLGSVFKQFTEVKQKYENALKKLVTAKKITQKQADEKIKKYFG